MPSLTQSIGLCADLLATTSCGIAWFRARNRSRKISLPVVTTVAEFALLIDMALDIRLRLHALIDREATLQGVYARRHWIQWPALFVLGIIAGAVTATAVWRFRRRIGAVLTICGLVVSLTCWCMEVISLHATDSLLYSPLGKTMNIAAFWVVGALATSAGIFIDSADNRR